MKLLTLNDTTNYILSRCYVVYDETVKASVLMSSVVTCYQLKSLSLVRVKFTHEDLKDLLDNLPQLVTMEMKECEYDKMRQWNWIFGDTDDYKGDDIDASVNVSCGIHTSVKNSKTSIQNS